MLLAATDMQVGSYSTTTILTYCTTILLPLVPVLSLVYSVYAIEATMSRMYLVRTIVNIHHPLLQMRYRNRAVG